MALQDFFRGLHPPPDRSINSLSWYLPLCFLSAVFASALRSRKSRFLCTLPILALFSQYHRSYTAEPQVDYPLSLWLMWILFRYVDISLIGANDKMWKVRTLPGVQSGNNTSDGKVKAREYLRDGSFMARLKRSFALWTTLRGVGWNWEIKHMKFHQGSRLSFLFSALLKAVSAKLVLDLDIYLRWRLPYGGLIPSLNLSQAPFSHQVALSWLPLLHIFVALAYMYWLAALIFVGLHIQQPQDWPYLFGDLGDAYTVGQAWSRTWHQTVRRVCTFLVAPLTDFLGVEERTSLHRNITLVVGFAMSGLIHYAGTCNLTYSPIHETLLIFFVLQPLAIMFEDMIIAVGRRLEINLSRKTKFLGYAWAFVWSTLSIRYFYLRMFLEDLRPISDVEWVEKLARHFD